MSQAGLLDTRARRRYVGQNGGYALLDGKPVQWGWLIAMLLLAAAAIAGLVLGAIAVSWGKHDVPDPLQIGSIKVTDMADFSMAEVIPGMWMIPPLPPTKRYNNKRMSVNYDVTPGNRQVILGNSGVTYNLRFPKQLDAYASKEYHIFSNTTEPHTVVFTGPGCGGSYADTTWDSDRKFPLAKFDARAGAYLHFKVVDCGTVTLIESRHVDFCFANMTGCEHPKRDVNADWADVKDLVVSGSLTVPECPEEVVVGPTGQFSTIQAAIDVYKNRVMCRHRIKIQPGIYNENLSFENVATTGIQSIERYTVGVELIGDERPLAAVAFVNGGIDLSLAAPGRPSVAVALTTGNMFTLTVSGLDLTTGGYGAGDKILIRDDNAVFYERSITSITANTVSFDGSPLPLSAWAIGSYFVFIPNVEVHPVTNRPSLNIAKVAVAALGMRFTNAQPGTGQQIAVFGGYLQASNILADSTNYNADRNVAVAFDGHFRPVGWDDLGIALVTGIGSRIGFFCNYNGKIISGSLNQFDASEASFTINTQSTMHVSAIQTSQSNPGLTWDIQAFKSKIQSDLFHCIHNSAVNSVAFLVVSGPSASITNNYGAFQYASSFIGSPLYAGYGEDSGKISLTNTITFDGPIYGILLIESSSAIVPPPSGWNIVTGIPFAIENNAKTVIDFDYALYGGQSQVYEHSANGMISTGNAYEKHDIVATSAITLNLDPFMTEAFGYPLNDGKTYTLTDTTGHNHTLILQSGGVFEGCGIPAGSNAMTFDGTVGANAVMFVKGTKVRVISKECVTFSTVVAKRTEHTMHQYYTGTLPAKFQGLNRTMVHHMLASGDI